MDTLNILLVDDDAELGAMMKLRLSKEAPGFSFHFVEGGKECLEYIGSSRVDCILSDYQMPGMNGMELLAAIRDSGNDVPFIFLTGQGNEEVAREAFKGGAYDYFTKDIGFAHFARIINSVEQAVAHWTSETKRRQADEALRASQQYLQTIIDTEPECVKLISADGTLLMMNRAGLDMIGADSPDQVEGKSVFGLIVPEYREAFKALGEKVYQGGAGTLEFEIVGFRGRRLWLETHAVPLRNERDEITALLGITRDITERRRAEEALEESRSMYKALAENLPGIVYRVFIREGGRMQFLNHAATGITGYADCELEGGEVCRIEQVMHPEDRDGVVAEVKRAVSENRPFTLEYRIRHKDGSIRHALEQGAPIFGPYDKPLYIDGVIFDITARKQMEEALIFNNILLSAQQEATLDGILAVDTDGKIISYNNRFTEIWNIPQEVADMRSDELAIQSVLHNLKKPDEFIEKVNYLYKHHTETCRDEIQLNDGRTLDRYTAPMLGADGRYYGRVWSFRDVTDLKNLERSKADFYAMVSHDLKSPLMVMLGCSGMITENAEKNLDQDTATMSKLICQSGNKILKLLDDFANASMLESKGTLSLNPAREDLVELLNVVHNEFYSFAEKNGFTLRVILPDALPKALIDRKLVERAVCNLLHNAFTYTPKGGEVTLKAEAPSDRQDGYIVVSVSDSGPGIAQEEQTKIFEKYYRSSKMCGIKGTGLGLSIVKAVAEAHSGRVELESEVGKGSTFRLILPITSSTA